jgi:hypothetical protein
MAVQGMAGQNKGRTWQGNKGRTGSRGHGMVKQRQDRAEGAGKKKAGPRGPRGPRGQDRAEGAKRRIAPRSKDP